MVAAHSILTKAIRPFILGYSVIAIVLHFSVLGKAYLAVCSVTLLAYWPAIVLTSVMKGALVTAINNAVAGALFDVTK